MSEADSLRAAVMRTGCDLLRDVNNVDVPAVNHGFDPVNCLESFPIGHADVIHVSGSCEDRDDDGVALRIDAHGNPVADIVWSLYGGRFAPAESAPTLIEWDDGVPSFAVLAAEAARARNAPAVEADGQRRRRAA